MHMFVMAVRNQACRWLFTTARKGSTVLDHGDPRFMDAIVSTSWRATGVPSDKDHHTRPGTARSTLRWLPPPVETCRGDRSAQRVAEPVRGEKVEPPARDDRDPDPRTTHGVRPYDAVHDRFAAHAADRHRHGRPVRCPG